MRGWALLLLGMLAVAAWLPGFLAGTAGAREVSPGSVRRLEIQARPIQAFQSSKPGLKRFGKLEFRGGLVLSSSDPSFGGLSGLTIEPDGRRLLAISDEGGWVSAEITYRGGVPVGLANATIGPLVGRGGRALDRKRDLDAESLTTLSGNLTRGTVLIGFEHVHRIGVFPIENGAVQAPARYLKLPPEARRMNANRGFEALAVLQGGPFKGSIVAICERFPGSAEKHVGWIWVRNVPRRFSLANIGGFDVTDAVSLADGTLIVLERRFRWTEGVKMRLRRIPAGDLKPGADLEGEMLLEADMSRQIDNMEGLAAHREPSGATVLTVISDNNFNDFLQRNLLLQFVLVDAAS